MRKAIVGAFAVVGILALTPPATAQDSKSPAQPHMGMMRGLTDQISEMEKRMGGIRQMMQGCMANEKTCPTDKMMMDMQAMQTRMGRMMTDMKSFTKDEQSKTQEKAPEKDKPEDHEQHH